MMSKRNKELLSELMAAIYAKETLEKIEKMLSETDVAVIEKKELQRVIEQNSDPIYFE